MIFEFSTVIQIRHIRSQVLFLQYLNLQVADSIVNRNIAATLRISHVESPFVDDLYLWDW